jgi:hypothetical protein
MMLSRSSVQIPDVSNNLMFNRSLHFRAKVHFVFYSFSFHSNNPSFRFVIASPFMIFIVGPIIRIFETVVNGGNNAQQRLFLSPTHWLPHVIAPTLPSPSDMQVNDAQFTFHRNDFQVAQKRGAIRIALLLLVPQAFVSAFTHITARIISTSSGIIQPDHHCPSAFARPQSSHLLPYRAPTRACSRQWRGRIRPKSRN